MAEKQRQTLRHHEQFSLREAQGWLELDLLADAEQALRQIPRSKLTHPDVLETRWKIAAARGQWNACLQLATTLADRAPNRATGWLYMSAALHKMRYTEDACETLQAVPREIAASPAIAYQLACYLCHLGRLTEAWHSLGRAWSAWKNKEFCRMILRDPELRPLWSNLQSARAAQ